MESFSESFSEDKNPFDGIFDNIDLPSNDLRSPEITPIYTGTNGSGAAVLTPATAAERGVAQALGISLKQQNNICVLARTLYINDKMIDANGIIHSWPTFESTNNSELMQLAGPPPTLQQLNDYILTDAFKVSMSRLGVYLGVHTLNNKQIAFLDMVKDASSKMTIGAIKRKLSISAIEYASWMKQASFMDMLNKGGDRVIREAIPLAKARIARKMEDGDISFIKFGFEVTGEYNPNDRKQVDAQALLRVVFEVLEEEIKDPAVLKRIGAKVQLRGSGGSVVQGSIEE